jgi:glycosyltransferase involved in cell wall biosynthesis
MPCYNAERWVGEAIHSILAQSKNLVNLIIIDDGSTDTSPVIIRRFIASGAPITLLQNERNLGIIKSLNRGLGEAQGQYIARMDADDICMPNRFERQVAFIEETGCDICGSWFIEFGQGIPRTVRWPHSEHAVRAAMLFQNALCHPTVIARREVFERFRYREEYSLVEDYDLFGRACGEFRMANIPEPLLRYRRHSQQATQAKRDAMETVTQRIRLDVLQRQGFAPTQQELRLHNLIRAPNSIHDPHDLNGIEAWLLKLYAAHDHVDARQVIASQWIRACIRAAPLGKAMWKTFRASLLYGALDASTATILDMGVLAATKLDYRSLTFAALRRFGLSA